MQLINNRDRIVEYEGNIKDKKAVFNLNTIIVLRFQ
jgi:hypothetical protein